MSGLNRPARLNRTLLTLIGLVLLSAGAFGLATRFLRLLDPATPLVPGTAEPPAWGYWVTAAVAAVLGLLTLRWLAAQLARRPRTHTWRFDTDPAHGRTELHADTAIAPFTDEVRALPHVHRARSTLAGTRDNPALALVVTTEPDADLAALRKAITAGALPRLVHALGIERLPVTVEFRMTSDAGSRVS